MSYGLTKNIDTYNPVRVALHEYAALWREAARTPRWRHKLAVALRRPGWTAPGIGAAQPEKGLTYYCPCLTPGSPSSNWIG